MIETFGHQRNTFQDGDTGLVDILLMVHVLDAWAQNLKSCLASVNYE